MSDTKQKLIQITRQLIDDQGVDAISMRELGKELNLSRSAMYRHFKNKEDLLAAVVTENFDRLNSGIHQLFETVNEPRKLIHAVLCTYFDYGIKNKEHYRLMFQKQWDKTLYPSLHESAVAVFGLVENGLKKAENLRKSPIQSTAMLFAFIHGLVELQAAGHSETEKGLDHPNELIDSFLDLFFQ